MLYLAKCVIEMTTPLHCGGGEEDGLLDAPVTRDAFGLWRIPGSSIAGILRAYMREAEAEKSLLDLKAARKAQPHMFGAAMPFYWIMTENLPGTNIVMAGIRKSPRHLLCAIMSA